MLIEQLNNLLYGSRKIASAVSSLLTSFATVFGLAIIIYVIGFVLNDYEEWVAYRLLDIIFLLFIANYFLRFLYSFQHREFLKNTWFEGFMVFMISLNGFLVYVLDYNLIENLIYNSGIEDFEYTYKLILNTFMFVLVMVELAKASIRLPDIKIKPATSFLISFIILILIGTGMLMLPAMTVHPGAMPFIDALFTSTSAACVTGHVVVDTATYFTYKGHLVILFLIQLGGIGIVVFATFFATFIKKGIGLRHHTILQDHLSGESLSSTKDLLRQVVLVTFVIEFIGFLLIYFTWDDNVKFVDTQQRVFYSAFHSISAFCNAGFSLFTDNLYHPMVRGSYIVHIIIALLIIVGGIGFSTIEDVLSPKALRERLKTPWKDWKINSILAVYTSAGLLFFGTLFYFILEYNNSLKGLKSVEAVIAAFFQSTVTRTAGFNTVDLSNLLVPTMIVMIFLMFVGGSSGSTAGGIKTSTFVLILLSAVASVKGKKDVSVARRNIPIDSLYKAHSIFVFAVAYNLIAVFFLSVFEPKIDLVRLVFEQVSAFATVGLSTGITAGLTDYSKIILIISMYIGRVGTLTLALALSSKVSTTSYKYPETNVMVG